jgi:sugar/nucleoside kinase (ribokinase family)
LIGNTPPADLQDTGNKLLTAVNIQTLIIHSSKISIAWDNDGMHISEPVFIAEPKMSTGAGDNFNAGYCIGKMLGLETEAALALANAASNIYINTGESPGIGKLLSYFSE